MEERGRMLYGGRVSECMCAIDPVGGRHPQHREGNCNGLIKFRSSEIDEGIINEEKERAAYEPHSTAFTSFRLPYPSIHLLALLEPYAVCNLEGIGTTILY